MRVYIRNKLISLGGSSVVKNEQGEQIYKVKGKFFSFTKKKKMYDMNKKLLYVIRNKYWASRSIYVFVNDAEGDRVATLQKRKWSFSREFEIHDTQDEMSLDGKFLNNVCQISRNGKPVGKIIRDIAIAKDAFILEANEEDIPFFTALVIAYDNLMDKKSKS